MVIMNILRTILLVDCVFILFRLDAEDMVILKISLNIVFYYINLFYKIKYYAI